MRAQRMGSSCSRPEPPAKRSPGLRGACECSLRRAAVLMTARQMSLGKPQEHGPIHNPHNHHTPEAASRRGRFTNSCQDLATCRQFRPNGLQIVQSADCVDHRYKSSRRTQPLLVAPNTMPTSVILSSSPRCTQRSRQHTPLGSRDPTRKARAHRDVSCPGSWSYRRSH